MNERPTRTLTENLLVSTLGDWAYASWAIPDVVGSGEFGADLVRSSTLGLIAEVVLTGLIQAGDVVDGVHVPWECSPAEAVERIVLEWLRDWSEEVPTPGAIVWLDVTAKGRLVAEAVLAREESAQRGNGSKP
jgi:hypothetical protein